MKTLGIIPARSGSKGIKDKNIIQINGKPLLKYTIEEAHKSILNEVILSTDSEVYQRLTKGTRVRCPILRPKELSTDSALTIDVVHHILDYLNKIGENFDIVMLLQPTCPLRSHRLINNSIKIMTEDKSIDSIVSVVEVGGNHPFRMKRIENDRLINFIDQGFEDLRPRQDLPKVYLRSGSIYCIRYNELKRYNSLVGKNVYPIIENPEDHVNLDTIDDLYLLKAKLNEKFA